jgi:hypothetical protein
MAKITAYGLEEVEKLNGAVKVSIQFDGKYWFDGFVLKQDGTPNKKTMETLVTCGFKSTDLVELMKGFGSGVLNESKDFHITTVTETYGDKEFEKVEWVNDPENPKGKKFSEAIDRKKLGGASISKMLSDLQKGNSLPNHAPSLRDLGIDDSEEIPF